jgi:3-isopropylmalate dehydrogenase
MSDWRLLLLPGDGIGPEVLDAARPVIEVTAWSLASRTGRGIALSEAAIGGAAVDATGSPLPPATLAAARAADAILMGAVGGPAWDSLPAAQRPEAGLLGLRKALGVYANLRPARIWPGQLEASPLRSEVAADVDLLVVRELTGGLYFGEPRRRFRDAAGVRQAVDTMTYSEGEVARIARVAFTAARRRRSRVVSVDKANVLDCSRLWREVVSEVREEFPDVALSHQLVDSMAMNLVAHPGHYDVILTENMFGDILSDLVGGVVGSLGLLPSASLGDGGPGLYEPVHGSAPDIAGRDLANPAGTILSFAMLLRHSLDAPAMADAVERAVARVLEETASRPLGTRAFGERTAQVLRSEQQAARMA